MLVIFTLFLIKKTSKINPNEIVSAYKDNVAFIKGPEIIQFSPSKGETPSKYLTKKIRATHLSGPNFWGVLWNTN